VWTAGTTPNVVLSDLPCAKERNRVVVNEFLQIPDRPNVWAVGDCAHVPDLSNPGKAHPPTAQHAIREGMLVAHNITAALCGRSLKPFCFRTIGLLASIGRRTGVARIFGFNLSGFFAWWLWRTLYLSKLPGLDKKVRVAFEWTLDLVFHKDVCAVNDQERRSLQASDLSEAMNTRKGEAQPTTQDMPAQRAEIPALRKQAN
jgi:NADH dehydrogenase